MVVSEGIEFWGGCVLFSARVEASASDRFIQRGTVNLDK